MRRTVSAALAALLVALAVVVAAPGVRLGADGPELEAGAQPAEAVRGMGSTPLDDIRYWAGQKATCGLSPDQLAAVMLGPVFNEAGTFGDLSPSPMTLGRWDTAGVDKLYAFGSKDTQYPKAMYHAGIGLWQFDSAGFYPLTAAGAINTFTGAEVAADRMLARWCNSTGDLTTRLKYTWGPWYACAGWSDESNPCLAVYHEVFDGTSLQLQNFRLWPEVNRMGGMVERSCELGGVTVVCHYVDPSKAQGYKDWAHPTYQAPMPLTAPFYVIQEGATEHRIWLTEDTGYAQDITATKPVTSNARVANVWSFTDSLCDLSNGNGNCGNPFGTLDEASGLPGAVSVKGWAIDPDTPHQIQVHVYVDGRFSGSWPADKSRPDVAVPFPDYTHNGYEVTINGVSAGSRLVCTYAINVGSGGNQHLGCATVQVAPGPAGFWDVPPGYPFLAEISWVAEVGISTGYPDGTFRPTELVARQAMAAFLMRLYHGALGAPQLTPAPQGAFWDVPTGHPFDDEIAWMAGADISTGFNDGFFRPSDPVTRQATAAFLMRLWTLSGGAAIAPAPPGTFSDVPPGHPFEAAISWLAGAGITTGHPDGTFRPDEPVTRMAMAAFLERFAELRGCAGCDSTLAS